MPEPPIGPGPELGINVIKCPLENLGKKVVTTMMEEVEIKWERRLKFSPRGHLHRHQDAVAALDARLPGDVLHTTPFAFCPCFLVVFFPGTWTWREKKEPPEDQDAGLGAKSLAGLY